MIWFYWLLGTLCYFYQFVFRTIFGTLGEDISLKFDLSVTELSTFFAAFMIAYPAAQIPAGVLLDKYGPRKVLSLAMLSLSLGVLIVSLTNSFHLALVGRVFMGIGSAFCFIGTSKIVTVWFPIRMMGFLLGTTMFMGGMGGAFSRRLYDALPTTWDINTSLLSMGICGVVIAFLLITFLKEKRHSSVGSAGAFLVKKTTFLEDLKYIFSNRQIVLAAFFMFFAYLPISIIGDSWGPTAFQNIFNTSKELADQTLPYFYVSFAFGALFYASLAANSLKRTRYVLMFEFFLAFVFLYVLLVHTSIGEGTYFGVPGFLILSAVIGFNLGGVALTFPLGCSHASSQISATIVGVMNMLCMVSGGVFSKIIGYIVAYYLEGSAASDASAFSRIAYQNALFPLLGTSLAAVIILLFMKPGNAEEETVASELV